MDLVKDYANLMHKVGTIHLGHLIQSSVFSQSLNLFTNTLESVNSAELNQVLVLFLTFLINEMSIKFGR